MLLSELREKTKTELIALGKVYGINLKLSMLKEEMVQALFHNVQPVTPKTSKTGRSQEY
jgi:hypothetical protein